MTSALLPTLRWQFDLAWRLARVHLPQLSDAMCLWEPAPGAWSVRRSPDGLWRPDWSDTEPDPAPPVTIGWLTWQMLWWWAGALSALKGEMPASHRDIAWPGSAAATVARLEALAAEWSVALSGIADGDLERPLAYPWPEPRPLRLTLAWANSELMKNAAEIGVIRHLYLATMARD